MVSPTSESADHAPDVLVVADGCLIASHRLSEWISNAPTMEEDVALGNIALDLLGQARGLLDTIGDENRLAYFRDPGEFRNPTICELPNGDFGHTMLRQLFLDFWLAEVWRELSERRDDRVRGVAEKAIKENAYHRRHSTSWVIRLGDGTEESHLRMCEALDELWPYRTEIDGGGWYGDVAAVLAQATLPTPIPGQSSRVPHGSVGAHTPHLTDLLGGMQSLARAHPGASW
jgi:ring-1,2-phenylacetyl-CoA epoxidase subunit PaaC